MLDICLLGTGGMMPMPSRFLTAMLARLNGRLALIDCGEGTQVTMKMLGWGFKAIDVICFTHFHADHISGLPGLLLTIGNAGRTEPLMLIGPVGLQRIVEGLTLIAPELPFSIEYIELDKDTPNPIRVGAFEIHHCPADHMVKCFAYRIDLKRKGKFDVERAKAQEIPIKCWNPLQKGETVTLDGKTYTPDMVLGPARKGLKVTYCTDTRPIPSISEHAKGSDHFICEGMYGETEKQAKAKEFKHMTFYEAAKLAKVAEAAEMWLTHFSPSLVGPQRYMDEVQKIFPAAELGKDGRSVELLFEEETKNE